MIDFIKKELRDWDPEGFIEMGCPDDEYDNEARQIYAQVSPHQTVNETNQIIQEIMNKSFHTFHAVKLSKICVDIDEQDLYVDELPYTEDPKIRRSTLDLAIKIQNYMQLHFKS